MVPALGAHVVGGVKVDEKKLLGEGDGGEEKGELVLRFNRGDIEGDREEGVDEEGEGH